MLEVNIAGLKLKNPLVLASGILGTSVATLNRVAEDAGAVVTKSVGVEAREGYRNPTVINWRCGLLNAVGLASPVAEEFAEELRSFSGAAALIVSLYGFSAGEFVRLVEIFEDVADAFELNMSCPHVSGAGVEVGRDPEKALEIVRTVKDSTSKPVIAKLSAIHDYTRLAVKLERAGIDAVAITNTLPGMRIDIVSRRPVLGNLSGGVSGQAIKPIAVKCIFDLYKLLDVPLIGCGGVTTFEDVLEFVMAGATAVEIGSAFYFSRRMIYSINESLIAFLRANGCRITDLIGAAHSSTG